MFISEIITNYNSENFTREFLNQSPIYVSTGGRIISIRRQRTLFMTIEWGQNTIQIMAESTNCCYEQLSLLHVGDIIEVSGNLTRTLRGELSIIPQLFNINSRTQHNLELRRDVESTNQLHQNKYLVLELTDLLCY